MTRMRRTKMARDMEARLAGVVYATAVTTGVNGVKVVAADTIRWVMKPAAGEKSTGGIFKAMQRAVKEYRRTRVEQGIELGLTAGAWFWDWVRTEQMAERMSCTVGRGLTGASARPDWRVELTRGTDGWWMGYTQAVLRAVLRLGHGNELLRCDWAAVKQATKQRVTGLRSGDIFRAALWFLALYEGTVVENQGTERVVSGDWTQRHWWDEVQSAMEGADAETVGALGSHVMGLAATQVESQATTRYMAHMCAGWGSGVETAAAKAGLTVLAVEIVESRVAAGSIPVVLDLSRMSWMWWRFEIARQVGIWVGQISCYWGGTPCTTVSKGDAGNERDGFTYNYRDHSVSSRPPAHPEGNARGDTARRDDVMAAGLVRMYTTQDKPWALENPAAYLWRQSYMEEINALKRQVSYCAYWSREEKAVGNFQKHTHIWTSKVHWKSIGRTGTGRCVGHREHDSLQDTKSQQVRCRVPESLVTEWLVA